jgi:hypothetical protein
METEEKLYTLLFILVKEVLHCDKLSMEYTILDNKATIVGRYNKTLEDSLLKLREMFDGTSLVVNYRVTRSVYSGKRTQDFINCKIELKERKEVDCVLGSLLVYGMISRSTVDFLFPNSN